jgi:hypothetical protein
MSDDHIPEADRLRIEALYRAAMTPEERALVDEFDLLDAQRLAGTLPPEKQTRWFLLASTQDGIWYRATMAHLSAPGPWAGQ